MLVIKKEKDLSLFVFKYSYYQISVVVMKMARIVNNLAIQHNIRGMREAQHNEIN